jgi:hypothetical protein
MRRWDFGLYRGSFGYVRHNRTIIAGTRAPPSRAREIVRAKPNNSEADGKPRAPILGQPGAR